MPAVEDVEGHAVIQVLDLEGTPYNSLLDVNVVLSSSNETILTIQEAVTIEKRTNYASVPFTSTTRAGAATIVVATQGLEPSENTVETMKLDMNMTLITPRTITLNQTFIVQVNVTSFVYPVRGAEVRWSAFGGVIKSEET